MFPPNLDILDRCGYAVEYDRRNEPYVACHSGGRIVPWINDTLAYLAPTRREAAVLLRVPGCHRGDNGRTVLFKADALRRVACIVLPRRKREHVSV